VSHAARFSGAIAVAAIIKRAKSPSSKANITYFSTRALDVRFGLLHRDAPWKTVGDVASLK